MNMLTSNSIESPFSRLSPPTPNPVVQTETNQPIDKVKAREHKQDKTLSNTLKAMATLAVVMAPQINQAAAAEVLEVETIEETPITAEDVSTIDRLSERAEGIKERAENLKKKLDPNGFLEEKEYQVGDYNLRWRPVDLDLKPRWKDGGPQLRLKGEFLETELSKDTDLGNGWTKRQGVTGRIRGEVSTYDDAELDLQAGIFREYRGQIGEFDTRFQGEVGVLHRIAGENEGLRAGISLKQEFQGGDYEVFGHDFSLHGEARQSAYHNLETGDTEVKYKILVGPRKDFDVKLLGKEGTLSVTVGPEIKGSSQGDSFDPGIGSKVRLRF